MNKIILLALVTIHAPLLAQQASQGAPTSMSDAFMQQLDMDKDGKVTKTEFLKPYAGQFAHMDKTRTAA